MKPKPLNFSRFIQLKHTVGPVMTTVRFPPERGFLESDNPT